MALLVPNLPANGWVVVYDPLPDELDPTSLVDAIGVGRVALTRTPDVGLNLTIHPIDGPKEQHRYGYLQPAADSPMIADDAIAAIAVPALAFDRRGYRLGRGKGYYDCTLARLLPSCHRIGVVAANRVVNQLPYEPHDVAMTAVCTSSEFFSLR